MIRNGVETECKSYYFQAGQESVCGRFPMTFIPNSFFGF